MVIFWTGIINTWLEYTVDIGDTTHNVQIGNFNSLAECIEFCMGETVLYSGYADEFNMNIISGVDTHIFH